MTSKNSNMGQLEMEYPRPSGWGKRHTQAAITFLALTITMAVRANMGLSIVAMTDMSVNSTVQTYNWDKQTQDMILSSFFWGYFVGNFGSGIIAHHIGGKLAITLLLLINGFIVVLFPWILYWGGIYAACVCRVLQGITQSAIYPSIHNLLGKWAPLDERGTLAAYIYGGSQFGTLIIMPIAGFMAASSIGWPLIFYTCGGASIAMGAIYALLGAASSNVHPTISEAERTYINGGRVEIGQQKTLKAPLKSILTSIPVWATLVSHSGSAFGYIIILYEIPTYMNTILHVNIKSNGFLSSLPFLAMWLSNYIISIFFDVLIRRKKISVTNARKTANTIGIWACAASLVAFAYVPHDNLPLAVFLLVLSLGFHSGVHVGCHINSVDLSPNFASIIMSICNLASSCCGTFVPIIVGSIVTDPYDVTLWRWCYLLTGAYMFVTNLVYILFTTTDVQPWNEPKNEYYEIPCTEKEVAPNQK